MFGWAGVVLLAWGVYLTGTGFLGLVDGRSAEGLDGPLVLTLILALMMGGYALLRPFAEPIPSPGQWPGHRQTGARTAGALAGAGLVVWTLPSRYRIPTVDSASRLLYPEAVIEPWIGVCVIALGPALSAGASEDLPVRERKPVVIAGALVVVLIATPTLLSPGAGGGARDRRADR